MNSSFDHRRKINLFTKTMLELMDDIDGSAECKVWRKQ